MDERIIYQNQEGGVSIIIPANNHGMTIEEIAEKDVPDNTPYEIVNVADIPSDRTFRGAWKKNGAAVDTDMPMAKEIAHDMRRIKRDEEFAPIDIKATIPSESAAAEMTRQVIRDKYAAIQVDIDGASTVDELSAVLIANSL